uniref:C-type lectin domain-containing protein n=1 Tax=Chromera velia CCMP2878 TaxID=1169474 RepID=A0A0G4IFY1_9ALVE|mmetsp:Transcript_43605/g.86015  ORF Transcript_43605/g.86015 Transcript_43605/m.86015 type:complete len:994 (+) Transcript_43605:163-3144(+)|eukprot:Cvel_14069.t1-p1 / transcript=Cvel_14069.t1 / gene=Cvel_14069 / organism=Chromera_velia_CCMP2878 / gene_product=C-type lectin domain family 10 member A, putative / transcript_product=C-type lectin domain family 10 member A, putative / location=Cvel_scaffold987:45234-50542(-) / protein_length=993 / sequence_SO=supercontig / SO=protein_coding / is_pseudo=false
MKDSSLPLLGALLALGGENVGSAPSSCPSGWTLAAGSCLFRPRTPDGNLMKASWSAAETYCQTTGAHLASVVGVSDLSDLQQTCKGTEERNLACWIGLNDREEEGKFEYSDGVTNFGFENWDPLNKWYAVPAGSTECAKSQMEGGDDTYGCDADCVYVDSGDGKFSDGRCGVERPFVCEAPARQYEGMREFALTQLTGRRKDPLTVREFEFFESGHCEGSPLTCPESWEEDAELKTLCGTHSGSRVEWNECHTSYCAHPAIEAVFADPQMVRCVRLQRGKATSPDTTGEALWTLGFQISGGRWWSLPVRLSDGQATDVRIPFAPAWQSWLFKAGEKFKLNIPVANASDQQMQDARLKIVRKSQPKTFAAPYDSSVCDGRQVGIGLVGALPTIKAGGPSWVSEKDEETAKAQGGSGFSVLSWGGEDDEGLQIDQPDMYSVCLCLWGDDCGSDPSRRANSPTSPWVEVGRLGVEGVVTQMGDELLMRTDKPESVGVLGFSFMNSEANRVNSRIKFVQQGEGCFEGTNDNEHIRQVQCDPRRSYVCDSEPTRFAKVNGMEVQKWSPIGFSFSDPQELALCHCYQECDKEKSWVKVRPIAVGVALDPQPESSCGSLGGPCENNGVCVRMPDGRPDACDCGYGFRGTRCESRRAFNMTEFHLEGAPGIYNQQSFLASNGTSEVPPTDWDSLWMFPFSPEDGNLDKEEENEEEEEENREERESPATREAPSTPPQREGRGRTPSNDSPRAPKGVDPKEHLRRWVWRMRRLRYTILLAVAAAFIYLFVLMFRKKREIQALHSASMPPSMSNNGVYNGRVASLQQSGGVGVGGGNLPMFGVSSLPLSYLGGASEAEKGAKKEEKRGPQEARDGTARRGGGIPDDEEMDKHTGATRTDSNSSSPSIPTPPLDVSLRSTRTYREPAVIGRANERGGVADGGRDEDDVSVNEEEGRGDVERGLQAERERESENERDPGRRMHRSRTTPLSSHRPLSGQGERSLY